MGVGRCMGLVLPDGLSDGDCGLSYNRSPRKVLGSVGETILSQFVKAPSEPFSRQMGKVIAPEIMLSFSTA